MSRLNQVNLHVQNGVVTTPLGANDRRRKLIFSPGTGGAYAIGFQTNPSATSGFVVPQNGHPLELHVGEHG